MPSARFGAIDSLRIPVEYLAELFTAGDVGPVRAALQRLAAMRSFMRSINLAEEPNQAIAPSVRLEPEEMFRAFLDYREQLGMVIHPAERGTYERLRAQLATGEPVVMPLLADRDLNPWVAALSAAASYVLIDRH